MHIVGLKYTLCCFANVNRTNLLSDKLTKIALNNSDVQS